MGASPARADPNWRLNSKPTAMPITAKPRRRKMAEITVMKTPAEAGLSQQFEAAKTALPGDPAQREQAFRLFAERGLPHRRGGKIKKKEPPPFLRGRGPPPPQPAREGGPPPPGPGAGP